MTEHAPITAGTHRSEPDVEALQRRFDDLQGTGAERINATAWAHIVALHRRWLLASEPRRHRLFNRLSAALEAFVVERDTLQARVDDCLSALPLLSPAQSEHCAQLREQGDLHGVLRYAAACRRRFTHSQLVDELAALRRALDASLDIEVVGLSEVDKMLRTQQQEILSALATAEPESASTSQSPQTSGAPPLKSIKVLRQRSEQNSVEQRVDQAIERSPESPGPLNPQMLAIKALTTMRELSPQYLQRYMAYLDTLFWLDDVDTAANPSKGDKKKNAAKARKKRT